MATPIPAPARRDDDPRLLALIELRSGDATRVRAALAQLARTDRLQIAQATSLLAWDDVAAEARAVLERHAMTHVGLLVDALVDPATDFAIRRRLPRVLGTVASPRAIEGLLWSLEDERFEVRYQAARAIDRLRRKNPELAVDAGHIKRAVERELSVPARVWQGHALIDRVDRDEDPAPDGAVESDAVVPPAGNDAEPRNLEHIFTLLGTIYPREAVRAAYKGVQSADPHLRGLAVEYLDSALAPAFRARLWTLIDASRSTASVSDAPGRSDPPRPATPR